MALYYNLSKLNQQVQNEVLEVQVSVTDFVFLAERKLSKIKKAITLKNYDKVSKHVLKLQKYLILFEIDECVEYTDNMIDWANKKGARKEVIEVFKPYKNKIEKALKEMRKDFKIATVKS